ncbi:MAG: hypothetical protein ACD_44C00469G0006 [uncultured bacterium]|nr:MAG: hypothetical protein ACD_44C00469G0006 [uncultured bacterium]
MEKMLSLEQIKEYIENICFKKIIDKITRQDTHVTNIAKVWSENKTQRAVQDYKNFLFLKRKYSTSHPNLPPSAEIDEIWHHHILDTQRYHEDCKAIFGEYLHHDPYFGLNGEEDLKRLYEAFEITQQLHFKEFGDYLWEYDDN